MTPEIQKPKGAGAEQTPLTPEVQSDLAFRLTARIKELEAMIMTRGLSREERAALTEELKPIKAARDLGFDVGRAEKALMAERDRTKKREFTAALRLLKGEKSKTQIPSVEEPASAPEPPVVRVAEEPAPPAAPAARPEVPRTAADAKPEGLRSTADILKPEEVDAIAAALKETGRGWRERMRERGGKIAGRVKEMKISREDVQEFVRQLSTKQFFGTNILEMTTGAGVGFLVRNAARYGLGMYAVPAGALAGALSGGVTTWLREKRRVVSRDEIVEKARSVEGGRKEKLESYLKALELSEANPDSSELKEEKMRLYQEMRGSFGIRRKQIFIGATKGALMGALGGFVGTWIADHFFSGTGQVKLGSGGAAENLADARKAARAAGGEALQRKIEAAAKHASGIEYWKTIKTGVASLDAKNFNVPVGRGEGTTHIARKLIHDYIVEQRALKNPSFLLQLDKAQLVYAEDYLRRFAFEGQDMGQDKVIRVVGRKIAEAIGEARGLTDAEIANLNKNWVGKIGKATWEKVLDYKTLNGSGNNFSKEILERARGAAAAAGRKAGEDAAIRLATPLPSPETTNAAGSWLGSFLTKYGALTAGGLTGLALFGVASYRYGGRVLRGGRGAIRDLGIVGRGFGKFAKDMAPDLSALTKRTRGTSLIAEALRRAKREKQDILSPEKGEPQGPVVDVEAQRQAEEAAQAAEAAREAARLEAARTETERVEHEKKIAADPVHILFKKFGQTVEPRDKFEYWAPSKEALDAREKTHLIFDNYPDFRAYLETLAPEQRAIAKTFETTFDLGKPTEYKGKTLGIWTNPSFQDKLEANPELKKEYYEIYPKIVGGLLAAVFVGLPEKKNPEEEIEQLMAGLRNKFSFGFLQGWSMVPLEDEIEGLRKLSRALEEMGESELILYPYCSLRIGEKNGLKIDFAGRLVLEIDPSFSEDQMREYIRSMQPKVKESRDLLNSSYEIRASIKTEHDIHVSSASYDKIGIDQEISALGKLKEALRGFPIEILKPSIRLAIGLDGVENLSGEVRINIPPNLSADETRAYLTEKTVEAREMLTK